MGEFRGAVASPVLSGDGRRAAFLAMKQDGYEADENHVLTLADVAYPAWVTDISASRDGKGRWDRSPTGVVFGADDDDDAHRLYLTAEHHGSKLLYSASSVAPSSPSDAAAIPAAITDGRSVADVRPLRNGNVFLSGSSFVDSSFYALATAHAPSAGRHSVTTLSSASHGGATHGLSDGQISDMWSRAPAPTRRPLTRCTPEWCGPRPLTPARRSGTRSRSWCTAARSRAGRTRGRRAGTRPSSPSRATSSCCRTPTGSTGYGQGFTDADRRPVGRPAVRRPRALPRPRRAAPALRRLRQSRRPRRQLRPVSYTHLTLPTIYSV